MQPDQWLAQYDATLQQAKAKADSVTEQVGQVAGSASSPDGTVTVRVNPSGGLLDLKLTNAIRSQDPDRLASAILDCARRAQRDAAGKVVEVMQDVFGEGETLDFVKSQLPQGYSGDGTDEPTNPARRPSGDDDDFGNDSYLRRS
ncbi:YbaB/EbfC family nucleoid-associated protein [Actinoalloteichus hymeniacidonis]|uniref:YbaB/EbfC DNA-binding family protein n=1 Tax=Actinoalloteichus hymeniacidonis TaxID=340345 RepID=A0AAC9MWJ2_9PSEU|nr:YbaB/EbfC family nucleoid-associated protein [Actinoalloteichus hymeniacidonis]AOS61111.1 hypothetical protein TL08_01350 [Actinoalloteichus hymeniacidonis]MBB5910888.1 DNA-binding protein YbaB [Actinoalloteichus hymeniacidonis]